MYAFTAFFSHSYRFCVEPSWIWARVLLLLLPLLRGPSLRRGCGGCPWWRSSSAAGRTALRAESPRARRSQTLRWHLRWSRDLAGFAAGLPLQPPGVDASEASFEPVKMRKRKWNRIIIWDLKRNYDVLDSQRLMSRCIYQFSYNHWSQALWAQPVFWWVKLSGEWWAQL